MVTNQQSTELNRAAELRDKELRGRIADLSSLDRQFREKIARAQADRQAVEQGAADAAARVRALERRAGELAAAIEDNKSRIHRDSENRQAWRREMDEAETVVPPVDGMIDILQSVAESGRLRLSDARDLVRMLQDDLLGPVNALIEAGNLAEQRERATVEHAERRRSAIARDEALLQSTQAELAQAKARAERVAAQARDRLAELDAELLRLNESVQMNRADLDAAKAQRAGKSRETMMGDRIRNARLRAEGRASETVVIG